MVFSGTTPEGQVLNGELFHSHGIVHVWENLTMFGDIYGSSIYGKTICYGCGEIIDTSSKYCEWCA